jgi:hypothetical protein
MTNAQKEKEIERLRGVVDELQEKIKLLTFDNYEEKRKIRKLKKIIVASNKNKQNVKEKLLLMKRLNDFSNINEVLAMLHQTLGEGKSI